MRLLAPAALLALGGLVNSSPSHASSSFSASAFSQQTATATSETTTINIPAGTRVTLGLVDPIWAKTAKAGDAVYAVAAFPVASNGTMLIPTGTYMLGQIDAVTKPGFFSPHALLQMHFRKIIFVNGYTLELADAPSQAGTATLHVDVSSRNDLLLDNGAQFEMIVQTPLALDASKATAAVRRSQPWQPGLSKSATTCRTIPATPGTSDTVIPGTPPTPGTPDITIPGPNGTVTTIPGTPGTPGTPPIIIPGTPGTPEISCPAPPAVVPGPSGPQIHRFNFQLTSQMQVAGKKLSPGSYEVSWIGTATTVQASLQQNGKSIAQVSARIVMLPEKSAADEVATRTNPDGSNSIASLQFAEESFEIVFD